MLIIIGILLLLVTLWSRPFEPVEPSSFGSEDEKRFDYWVRKSYRTNGLVSLVGSVCCIVIGIIVELVRIL